VKVVLCAYHAYGFVNMWCHLYVHVVLCTSDIVYMLYKWYDVHVVLYTRSASGVAYM